MDRTDVAVLVNSTPAYYYILPFFFGMLRRYAPNLKWAVFLATEVPNDPMCIRMRDEHGVQLLTIPTSDAGFLESRRAALEQLGKYKYCFPLQDDFILEAAMDADAITAVLDMLDFNMNFVSARLMPCPGPIASDPDVAPGWKLLTRADPYGFVFQATLWKTEACLKWYMHICNALEAAAPKAFTEPGLRRQIEISQNIAENSQGQSEFWGLTERARWQHIAWVRKGPQPNAVYLSPFPCRPTAIVRGYFEEWAKELARREGF
jgi:hypothetical protein